MKIKILNKNKNYKKFLKIFYNLKNNKKIIKKIIYKYYFILPIMINNIIYIYNGKEYIPIFITKKMIFHKLGEFIFTKKIYKKYNKDFILKLNNITKI